ncbi:hypothetical protein [Opitutus terrae]|uniref:hypothetical protein n=1 Tax=Opitutus terrae TaxID=107709 RepID=UPI000323B440|nr:hypothetical protein [Opitutus terrae]
MIPAPPEAVPPVIVPAPTPETGAQPPKFPVIAEGTAEAQPPRLPPPVPHLRAPSGMKEEDLLPGAAPARRKLPVKTLALAGVAAIVVLGAGAFFFLQDSAPPPAPARTAKPAPATTAPAKPGPTPSATLNAIAAVPGAAIGKAKDVVAARRNLEQERVNAMADGEEAPAQRALNTPLPAALTPDNSRPPATKPAPSVAIRTTSELSPGVSATTTVSEMSGTASPGFQAWVANARINGVFNGNPPRALINGRTVRAGQSVDDALGIVFDSVDPQEKTITFRDATGAKLTRRY